MAIRESEFFTFADQNSKDFGILNVNIDSGLQEEPFVASRSIREVQIRGRSQRYFQGIDIEPLQFKLNFAFQDKFDEDKKREIARWLFGHNYFQPLIFSADPNRVYYVMFIDNPTLIHNCLSQGYVTLTARNSDGFAYSPIYESRIYDFSSNTPNGTEIIFENLGDIECRPIIYVEIINGSTFSITNNSKSGETLSFSNLALNEILTIDCETEDITTNLPLTYRFNDHNGIFLSFVRGYNYLNVKGKIKLKWKYQFKLY